MNILNSLSKLAINTVLLPVSITGDVLLDEEMKNPRAEARTKKMEDALKELMEEIDSIG